MHDRNYYRTLTVRGLQQLVKYPVPNQNWEELAIVLAERLASR